MSGHRRQLRGVQAALGVSSIAGQIQRCAVNLRVCGTRCQKTAGNAGRVRVATGTGGDRRVVRVDEVSIGGRDETETN